MLRLSKLPSSPALQAQRVPQVLRVPWGSRVQQDLKACRGLRALPVRSVLRVQRVPWAPQVFKASPVRKASLAQWVRRVLWAPPVLRVNPVRKASLAQ
jgi:hypothetical protein